MNRFALTTLLTTVLLLPMSLDAVAQGPWHAAGYNDDFSAHCRSPARRRAVRRIIDHARLRHLGLPGWIDGVA